MRNHFIKHLLLSKSFGRGRGSFKELPDLTIYAKPLNETGHKFLNIDQVKYLNDKDPSVNDYSSLESFSKHSVISSIAKLNRNRKHHSLKKARLQPSPPLRRDMCTGTEEYVGFGSLLKDPMKIEQIISVLTDLKNEIIK